MLVALLHHWAAHKYSDRVPEWFQVMEDEFDAAVCADWDEHLLSKMPPICFMNAYQEIMSLLIDPVVVERICAAEAAGRQLDLADVRIAMDSRLGREMFEPEAKKLRHRAFCENIVAKLADVVHMDFEVAALASFETSMKMEADSWRSLLRKTLRNELQPCRF